MTWVFFGTDEFAVGVLAELKQRNLIPNLLITTPDRPAGRGLKLTPPPVKLWAEREKIPCLTNPLINNHHDLFVVASYGKILKPETLALAKHGTLNVHPSLLPKYRGPAPIQSALLNGDTETGVTIMLLDEEMDHGPIIATQTVRITTQNYNTLRDELAKVGANLLADILPNYLAGKIKSVPQNHTLATYTKKIKKGDGEIKLTDDPELNWRKFRALMPWPGVYFFESADSPRVKSRGRRIKITAAEFTAGKFIIKKVIPAGGKEIAWGALS